MAQFPLSESHILKLAEQIRSGIAASPELFVHPPVEPDDLGDRIAAFWAARARINQARTRLQEALKEKDRILIELKRGMKQDLRYAEIMAGTNPESLKRIGWSPRRSRRSMQSPGQPMLLRMELRHSTSGKGRSKVGTVRLYWKPPITGGKAAGYLVQRRLRRADPINGADKANSGWTLIDSVMNVETFVPMELLAAGNEFRVLAINRAGESRPSNAVGS